MTKEEAIKLTDKLLLEDNVSSYYMHSRLRVMTEKDTLIKFFKENL